MLYYSLKQLQYFLVAGETCNMTEAAKILCVSQPSISSAIAHLENEFGVQLFIRHHAKGLDLTSNGKKILAQSKDLLKQAQELQNSAKEIKDSIAGVIDLACFVTLAPVLAPALIKNFQNSYSNARVNCYEADQDGIFDGLLTGKFDFAFTYELDIPDFLDFEPISYYEPYIIVHSDHPLSKKKSVTLKQFEKEPMVLLDLPHSRQYFESIFNTVGFSPFISYKTISPHLVRSMVTNGLGYSIMNIPIGNNNSLDGKAFVKLKLRDELKPTVMGIVKLSDYKFTKLVDLFYYHCKNNLR